jgi:hypothetical protein
MEKNEEYVLYSRSFFQKCFLNWLKANKHVKLLGYTKALKIFCCAVIDLSFEDLIYNEYNDVHCYKQVRG